MFFSARLRLLVLYSLLSATFLIAGCAQPTGVNALNDQKSGFWTGRLSLQLQGEAVQSFHASFELKGEPDKGELTLISPLGSILGVLRWSPLEAVLDSGNQSPQRFGSVDALMAQATGAAVPIGAIFAWLRGDNASASGWTADLSRQSEGRITATRSQPAPRAELRIVLDQ